MSIVKSFSVGDGDMFYIKHNSDNFTTIDCCNYSDGQTVGEKSFNDHLNEIERESQGKNITRFISTHPDDDHIGGLEKYDKQIGINNFYCVENKATKLDKTDDFEKYCELRDGNKHFYLYEGCSRKWMNESNEERDSAGITCLWPITTNEAYESALEKAKKGESPNNISPIITYSVENGAKFMWMGDLEKDFIENIKNEIEWTEIDILFAPHHGRDSGKLPSDVLKKLNPKIVVIGEAPSKDLNYYAGYYTITQNSAGDIIFECVGGKIHIFVSKKNYPEVFCDSIDIDALPNFWEYDEDKVNSRTDGYYLVTLNI
jgi:beta-lactamase superfamily II metal-dependent hydrolase